jgi:hypothetical protein
MLGMGKSNQNSYFAILLAVCERADVAASGMMAIVCKAHIELKAGHENVWKGLSYGLGMLSQTR